MAFIQQFFPRYCWSLYVLEYLLLYIMCMLINPRPNCCPSPCDLLGLSVLCLFLATRQAGSPGSPTLGSDWQPAPGPDSLVPILSSLLACHRPLGHGWPPPMAPGGPSQMLQCLLLRRGTLSWLPLFLRPAWGLLPAFLH